MKHRIGNLALVAALAVTISGLAAQTAQAGLPPAGKQQLARILSGLSGRDTSLVISAVGRAPWVRQQRIVRYASRLTPRSRRAMVVVLGGMLQPLSLGQSRAVVDGLVGVAPSPERRVSALVAARELAAMADSLPPRLRYETYAVFHRYPPETQLAALASNRLIVSQIPAWQVRLLVNTLESLLEAIPPQYEAYSRSLVADLVGLATPADEQRVQALVAYLRLQVEINAFWAAVNADLHATTIYQGRRSACVLGGGLLSGSGTTVIDGQFRTASICNNDLIVR